MPATLSVAVGCLVLLLSSVAWGQSIVVTLPEDVRAAEAVAETRELGVRSEGVIEGRRVRFEKLLPDTPYELTIRFADGTRWVGVSSHWHSPLPDEPPARPIGDADRRQIRELVTKVPSFYNRVELLDLRGDAGRAVALVQLVRDDGFYGDRGGEIIWRVERWFYEFHAGGWSRVPQQADVLRRERFRSRQAFDEQARSIRWMPQLGDIAAGRGQTTSLELASPPATRPSE